MRALASPRVTRARPWARRTWCLAPNSRGRSHRLLYIYNIYAYFAEGFSVPVTLAFAVSQHTLRKLIRCHTALELWTVTGRPLAWRSLSGSRAVGRLSCGCLWG